MKKFGFILGFLMTLMSYLVLYSCSSLEDDVNCNQLDNPVVSNAKFSCYELNETRSLNEQMLIKVHDLPNVDIIFQKNDELNKNEYSHKSIFYENGEELFALYSNVEIKSEGFLVSYSCSYGDSFQMFLPKVLSRSWGQDTMDCMADVYSNHGWVSVWVFVQTAFLPQTAVAFAAACAVKNY